ncbi:hypothetical protein BGW38_002714 [Lunasporangiospora selenospora]|uniref:Uncharacterized protein n=1 Tax=Lunasporangiospora selenospora TaxID=979761 RepID=A0A9P6FSC8_9FUNG|nr:hypothetical protein BGW38_002714 [Lunasporangiospora selenospora]
MLSSHQGKAEAVASQSPYTATLQAMFNNDHHSSADNRNKIDMTARCEDMDIVQDMPSPYLLKHPCQRKEVFLTAESIRLQHQSQQHQEQFNSFNLALGTQMPYKQQSQPHSLYRAGSGSEQSDSTHYNTPPANCKSFTPNMISRRSSYANITPTTPTSAGLVKSTTTSSLFDNSSIDTSGFVVLSQNGSEQEIQKQRPLGKKRPSILNSAARRQSAPNTTPFGINPNSNHGPGFLTALRTDITNSSGCSNGMATDVMYLPTPTESTFQGDIGGEIASPAMNVPVIPMHLPPTPSDAYFTTGVHPLDTVPMSSSVASVERWFPLGTSGVPAMPPPMPTAVKSAAIQYMQQLQQTMAHQSDPHGLVQRVSEGEQAPIDASTAQQHIYQSSGPQARKGSKIKIKIKKRAGSYPVTTQGPTIPLSIMSNNIPWSMTPDQLNMLPPQMVFSSSSSMDQGDHLNLAKNVPPNSRPYHGPAPCGNPEPLYEYLASPTVVPGLEIIGHDYYGNYVQILPICPETTCSMNQDPIYLNLLQAIYAHTIPFLDLAPGSEEEAQLLRSTPSAITTQSIQPPFKNLLPLNLSGAGHSHHGIKTHNSVNDRSSALDEQLVMSSSVSTPSFQQSQENVGPNNRLSRRASMTTIGTSSTAPSSRRSSVASTGNLHNPAKKKKNQPRTHPYKSTSSFKDDNTMVTEAILNEVGGVGSIGSITGASATDPRRKVAEKTIHMDEAEYAAHYTKHHHSMKKSSSSSSPFSPASTVSVSTPSSCPSSDCLLAQTLVTSMTGGSTASQLSPCSLMSTSVSAPSITNATALQPLTNSSSNIDSIAAADFIRALSGCSSSGLVATGVGGQSETGQLGKAAGSSTQPCMTEDSLSKDTDVLCLENLMMIDTSTAAMQQQPTSTWPNWFDFHQLEKDICDIGIGHQESAFPSASSSFSSMPLSSSTSTATNLTTLSRSSRENTSTNLLLASGTDIALGVESSPLTILSPCQQQAMIVLDASVSPKDKEMTLATPTCQDTNNSNSTSQILVFEHYGPEGPIPSTMSMTAKEQDTIKGSVTNDLVLPFSAQHTHPIFPTRGNRRSGWYRSKSVASQGLSEITGVDYTTTCWYDVEQLQNVVRDSIKFQESSGLKSLEDLTEPNVIESQ